MDFVDFFIEYWVQWVFGLVAAGIGLWAKHYIKLERQRMNNQKAERMKELREEIADELELEIKEVDQRSQEADKYISAELEVLSAGVENLTIGLLSMQGREFRETCLTLLNPEHEITIQEYEQFEEDYSAYKALNGNHKGDALHSRVVEKFNSQIIK